MLPGYGDETTWGPINFASPYYMNDPRYDVDDYPDEEEEDDSEEE